MTMLWPKILNKNDNLPYQIIIEQVYLFNNCLDYGYVCASTLETPLNHKSVLYLSNEIKSIEILRVDNDNSYPCKLWFDGTAHQCRTQAELMGKLTWAFNHQKTIDIIVSLMIGL